VSTATPMPVVDGVIHHNVRAGGLSFHVAEAGRGRNALVVGIAPDQGVYQDQNGWAVGYSVRTPVSMPAADRSSSPWSA
jgi:hypothetical protein